ncbi:phage tail protein [uncultured Cellulomonas sp.]|uniref:phage tail protein n=1 Tax=uncultured Cellulomonas sp. TaxID=189682 RepID=UPI002603700B|nr:phage tail protein [uncultured Cellulomonas sp.]
MTELTDLSAQARQLADLLPDMLLAIDAESPDRPLLRLLEVLAAPLAELSAAVDQLGRDPFVSRSSAQALPLIAELVGAQLLGEDAPTNRRVVAGTVAWRRRKGTLATLEDVLTRTTGWPAEVDEGFRSLLVTQDVTEPLPSRGWTALLWDPVALADPLTRRARQHVRHPSAALDAPRTGDDVTETLRRLGAPDALLLAASPRTVDLDGWARPDGVAIRTSRVVVRERDDVVLPVPVVLATTGGPPLLGLRLDPADRDGPVAARVVAGDVPALTGYTEVHETPPPAPVPRRPELLTATDLAADPDAVAGGDAVRLAVDGVPLLGAAGHPGGRGPLPHAAPGPDAVLRFADAGRPGPGETWTLAAAAVRSGATLAATLAGPAPSGEVDATDPVTLRATTDRDSATLEVTPAGAALLRGADVALRLDRTAGGEVVWRRLADGRWQGSALVPHEGEPVSGAVVVPVGGLDAVVRLVRLARPAAAGGDALAVARFVPPDVDWTTVPLDLDPLDADDRPGTAWLDSGPAALLVPAAGGVVLVAPASDGAAVRAWRLADLDAAAVTVTQLDVGSPAFPPAREAAAGCLAGDVLSVHGGQQGTVALDDLWQLALAGPLGGRWVQRRVRDRVVRSGGQLLATADGLVRVGGADERARLCPLVHRMRDDAPRPRWEPLPPLPVPDDAPGTLWAWDDAGVLRAVVWGDRVRPRAVELAAGAGAWHAGDPEPEGPNPPAEGETVVRDGELLVVGAPPLPPSEVVVTVGGAGHLVFLPALDPRPGTGHVALIDGDGSTRTWFAPGTPARFRLRLGRNREAVASRGRDAPAVPRVGVPGRIGWSALTVRQASLGPWDRPVALDLDDAVALDPRLGRVALPAALAGVRPAGTAPRFTASTHVARGAALGAGFVPPGAVLPGRWVEPPDPADPSRFALPDPPGTARSRPPDVVLGPPGRLDPAGRPVVTRLDTALGLAATATGPAVIAVLGSPRLAPATGVVREGAVTSVHAADPGGVPFLAADDDGVSLTLLERAEGGGRAAVGPHVVLTGLAAEGTVELAVTSGAADLRWSDLGQPGGVGLRVAGAGHHTALLRATPAEPALVLRLHGCVVGRLDVPPWVLVIAAGCTFDAGDRVTPAISAAGATLRLRECTVHGAVLAGVLEASLSVFAGPLTCDRPDLGWLRRCVAPRDADRRPRSWRGLEAEVSFADVRPTWPGYLVLDDNNTAAVRTAGEGGHPPGAHADRGRSLTELTRRTDDFLPLGLTAHHSDRAADDVHRMGRSLS